LSGNFTTAAEAACTVGGIQELTVNHCTVNQTDSGIRIMPNGNVAPG